MQHYAAPATLKHEIMFTKKNENQKQSQTYEQHLPLHASSMPDREYILQKYSKFKTFRAMQTKNCIHEEVQNKSDLRNPC